MIKARSHFRHVSGQHIGQRYGQVLLQGTHDCAEMSSSSVRGLEMARICFIYFCMVRLLTHISSLRSSPPLCSAPHSGLSLALSLIKLIVSSDSLRFRECAL